SSSSAAPPLKSAPERAPAAIADNTAAGVLITTAHGDATTRNVIARYQDADVSSPAKKWKIPNRTGTESKTAIVYGPSNRSANTSVGLFSACACSTSRTSFASALSLAGWSTRATTTPSPFSVPLNSFEPGAFSTGTDSPVSSLSSTLVN